MNKNIIIAGLAALLLLGGGIAAYRHFHAGHGSEGPAAQKEV